MAETDVLYEFGREPGFSSLVYSHDSSHMLHTVTAIAGILVCIVVRLPIGFPSAP